MRKIWLLCFLLLICVEGPAVTVVARPTTEMTPEAVAGHIARSRQTVVEIFVYTRSEEDKTLRSYGSGVWLSQRNLIVTNAHLVDSAQEIFVKTFRGDILRADFYKVSSVFDVALLVPERPLALPTLSFFPVGELTELAPYLSIYYDSHTQVVSPLGHVKKNQALSPSVHLFSMDFDVVPGASGGGIFDENGMLSALILGGIFSADVEAIVLSTRVLAVLLDDLEEILFQDIFLSRKASSIFGSEIPPLDEKTQQALLTISKSYWYNGAEEIDALVKKMHEEYPGRPDISVLAAFGLIKKHQAAAAYERLLAESKRYPSGMGSFFLGKIAFEFLHNNSQAIRHYNESLQYINDLSFRELVFQRIRIAKRAQ